MKVQAHATTDGVRDPEQSFGWRTLSGRSPQGRQE